MKLYWQFEFLTSYGKKIRYFHGTEAAVQRKVRSYKYDVKDLKNISKTRVDYLKMEKKAHIIDL